MCRFTNDAYQEEAEVIGQISSNDDVIDFSGTWYDLEDGTGEWDVFIEFAKSDTITFTYVEPGADASVRL